MIKKLFNWSFGAFFRTIGRVLAYFLIGLLLLIIGSKLGFNLGYIQVNATTSTNWASSLSELDRAQLYDCTANNSCANVTFNLQGIQVEPSVDRNILVSTNALTISTGGIAVQVYSGSLKAGYLYQTSFYMCSNKDLGNSSIYSASYDTPGVSDSNSWETTTQGLSGTPGNGNHSWNTCRVYSGLYVPNTNGGWIVLRLRSNSAITNAYPTLIAYETEELGIYSDTIRNIIQNSGFATADSVEEVKEATDKIKEETEKVNNTLTDTSNPDTEDSINQWSEKMIDNPLEAVVMLPLTILNSIKNSLSGTCSALNVPVPFINENINIPCISTIFAQIEGVTEFWNSIGTIVSALMLYQYLIYLYNWIDDTISLKTKRMHGWGSV